MDIFLHSFIGLIIGYIAGLLPGLGPASAMLIMMPYFINIDPVSVICAYLSLSIGAQYASSIMAITIGVPGMESAAPTAREFNNIKKYHLELTALRQNATSSLIGSVIGMGLFSFFVLHLADYPQIFRTDVRFSFLVLAYFLMVLVSERKLISMVMLFIGSYISSIGFNENTFELKNFGFDILNAGIPWIPLILGSIIGDVVFSLKKPEIVHDINKTEEINTELINKVNIYPSVVRSSFLGFFVGFIPGLTYKLSSILTYMLEYKFNRKKHKIERTLRSIAGSEASHSSGLMAMLMPLLLFSIPISISEGILLNVITLSSSLQEIIKELLVDRYIFIFSVVFISILSFLITYYSKHWVKYVINIDFKHMKWIMVTIGIVSVIMSSQYELSFELMIYFITLFIFFVIRLEPLTFVMGVFLFPYLRDTYYVLQNIS